MLINEMAAGATQSRKELQFMSIADSSSISRNQGPFGIVRTVKALRARVEQWKSEGRTVALVPTMGALHAGHLSLVHHGRKIADKTVASIFVNPSQFAPHEDLATYPRDEEADFDMLKNAGCDLAYAPDAQAMYPPGYQTSVTVTDISQGLCGASRPHFFGGVATVVCKLLNQSRPDMAIFGEKDFQQLLVIRRMVRDLDMGMDIIGAPIIREPDGLAMSSRNAYLSKEERAIAPALFRTLTETAEQLRDGKDIEAALETARRNLAADGITEIDYLEVRQTEPFETVSAGPLTALTANEPKGGGRGHNEYRLFAAAQLGRTRLIDNIAIL